MNRFTLIQLCLFTSFALVGPRCQAAGGGSESLPPENHDFEIGSIYEETLPSGLTRLVRVTYAIGEPPHRDVMIKPIVLVDVPMLFEAYLGKPSFVREPLHYEHGDPRIRQAYEAVSVNPDAVKPVRVDPQARYKLIANSVESVSDTVREIRKLGRSAEGDDFNPDQKRINEEVIRKERLTRPSRTLF